MLALAVGVIAVFVVLLGCEVAALKRIVLAQAEIIDSMIRVLRTLMRDDRR